VRLSEFRRAVEIEFGGAYGAVITRDLVLNDVGGVTAEVALSHGRDARDVWLALCVAANIPEVRRYGVGQRSAEM